VTAPAPRLTQREVSSSSSAAGPLRGSVEPRLWTPPLRELTPDTSIGFDVIRFSDDVLRHRLDPWQRWALIHAGELLPDGRLRFRRVVIVVARQNGKTEILSVLCAYWLFVELIPVVLCTAAKLPYAKKNLQRTVKLVNAASALDDDHDRRWTRVTNGEVSAFTRLGTEYLIAAANGDAGRGLTVGRVGLDELRQQHDYDAWDAASNAMTAVADGQLWALTNAGSERSIVLNDLRDSAIEGADPELCWLEWSAPEDARTDDPVALAMANPDYGGRIRPDALLNEARAAIRAGGAKLAGFRTEKLCIPVRTLNPAVNGVRWRDSVWPGDLAPVRRRVALCLDVAPDGEHATLVAAAVLPDGRVGLDVVASWAGEGATDRLRTELPEYVAAVRPRVLGWFPAGPAAELVADMVPRTGWPPAGVRIETIRGETPAACMALASLVDAGRIAQPDDPLLTAHVTGAEKLPVGDGRWVFARSGRGHCDGAYAAAGAVQLARTLPAPVGVPRVVVVTDD